MSKAIGVLLVVLFEWGGNREQASGVREQREQIAKSNLQGERSGGEF